MRGKNKIFWGIVLVLGAVAILAHRLGFLEGIGFWPVFFSVCLAACLIRGIIRGRIGTILFSLAFLIIVNDELLHLEAITPWPVLAAALLGTMGLKLLFPKLARRSYGHFVRIGNGYDAPLSEYVQNGGTVSYDNVFGEAIKYIEGEISSVEADNVFGSMQIYFTEATLSNGSARVNVDGVFGSVELYVPSSWTVILDVEHVFASTEEEGRCNPDGQNVLHVGGDMVFGSLRVIHV